MPPKDYKVKPERNLSDVLRDKDDLRAEDKMRKCCSEEEQLAIKILTGKARPNKKYTRDWAKATVYEMAEGKALVSATSTLWELKPRDVGTMLAATPFLKMFVKQPAQTMKCEQSGNVAFNISIRKEFPTERPDGDD